MNTPLEIASELLFDAAQHTTLAEIKADEAWFDDRVIQEEKDTNA